MGTETTQVETTEFDDGSAIITTTTTESEYIEGETPVENVMENVEEIAGEENAPVSDAVAIAEIEAERDITIAAIQADTTTAIIEAEKEREISWQEEVADLRMNMQELREAIANLSLAQVNPSTPDPLTEAAELEAVEITEAEANNSTPVSTLTPPSETQTEVIPESAGASLEVKLTVPERRKRRLI